MTRHAGLLPILGLMASFAACSPEVQAREEGTLEDLSWLSGCWAGVGGETASVEQWMTPAGGVMMGMSRTIRNSRTVAYEYMQIRQSDDGRIEYTAMPSGQPAASFAMVGLSDSEVIFENLDHDFPQRIIYRLQKDGNLEASIEGHVDGQARTVAFPMRSIPCRPPAPDGDE